MAAVADLKALQAAKSDMVSLEEKYPEAYVAFELFFNNHKMIGYKNIMKMMLYDKTPESLKE